MTIYTVINQKGGVGKTTTAAALAAGLNERGKKALLIDLDAQCNLSYTYGVEHSSPTAFDLLTGNAEPAEVIQPTAQGDIMPGSPNMAAADITLTETGKEYRLKEALQKLKGKYKYIVIDTPPALSIVTVNALTAADIVIIPTQAEQYSLQGIGNVYNTINTVKKYCNPDLRIGGLLITRYENATIGRLEAELIQQTAEAINTKVFSAVIRTCTGIKEAQATRHTIYTYKPKAKVKKAIIDYDAFIDELLKAR